MLTKSSDANVTAARIFGVQSGKANTVGCGGYLVGQDCAICRQAYRCDQNSVSAHVETLMTDRLNGQNPRSSGELNCREEDEEKWGQPNCLS